MLIRIVGTHNTANEVFHCVHFESPAVTNVPKAKSPSEDPEQEDGDNEVDAAEAGVEAAVQNTNSLQGYEEAMVGLNDAKDDAFSHVSIHSSPSSNAGSVSAGMDDGCFLKMIKKS